MKDNLITELAKNEETIAELYQTYAQMFVGHKDFWSRLAVEEKKHAAWLRNIDNIYEEEQIMIDKGALSSDSILTFRENILEQIQYAKDEDIDILKALATAKINEESLIEKKCFNIFKSDSIELNKVFEKLQLETERHFQEVDNMFNKIKKGESNG